MQWPKIKPFYWHVSYSTISLLILIYHPPLFFPIYPPVFPTLFEHFVLLLFVHDPIQALIAPNFPNVNGYTMQWASRLNECTTSQVYFHYILSPFQLCCNDLSPCSYDLSQCLYDLLQCCYDLYDSRLVTWPFPLLL